MSRVGRGLRRKAIAIPVAAASLALVPAGAWGVADVIKTTSSNQFDRTTYSSDQGDLVQLQHTGGGPHNVTSTQSSGGQPLFKSATISSGTANVTGTQFLSPGTYPFVCTIHDQSTGMGAELVVSGTGTPAARPDIEVKILSKGLDKVVNKGKLNVKIRAVTKSKDAKLVAKLGKRLLGKKADIDLAAGQVRKLALKLSRKGRDLLEDRNKAKVKLKGTVPFGEPDVFRRVLK
jgi:plastocyanin